MYLKTTGRRARGHGERRMEPFGRVFGGQSTWGHHTNVLWKFGEVLFFMIFDFFELVFSSDQFWSSISAHVSASQQISKNIFQQARSAVGSEVRGLGRPLRRLFPSNQPMEQLRTEYNCPENCVRCSSELKQSYIKNQGFCLRTRTRQNVVAL